MNDNNYLILSKIQEEAFRDIAKLTNKWGIEEQRQFFLSAVQIFDKLFLDKISHQEDGQDVSFDDRVIDCSYSVFIELFYSEDFCNLQGIILEPLTQERINLYLEIIYSCGVIGWMRSLIKDIQVGSLKCLPSKNKVRIRFSDKYHWNEYLEAKYFLWYSQCVASLQANTYKELDRKRLKILDKMRKNVSIWRSHFMSYTNDFEIEDYFNMQALLDAQQATEWDMFPPSAKFENIDYRTITQAIIDFAGYAIKHLNFATILYNISSNLIFENLLLCVFTQEDIVRLIAQNQNVNKLDAEKIFDLISIAPDKKEYYRENINAASAPFIKLSQNQYIRSIRGLLDRPFEFMLFNLRLKYPNSWDLNGKTREAVFRDQINSLFEDTRFICFNRPVVIRLDATRILTDIDAIIIDKQTHEVALFQLKWQDPTNYSSFELKSKASNYNKSTQKWVLDINNWLQTCDSTKLSSVLGVKKQFIDMSKIYIFVIGRRHGNYSGNLKPLDNCAWAQWYQFLYTIKLLGVNHSLTIGNLHKLLITANPFNIKIKENRTKFEYGKYCIDFGGGFIR